MLSLVLDFRMDSSSNQAGPIVILLYAMGWLHHRQGIMRRIATYVV